MSIFSKLKQWYFDTFLPYENPEHPLYSDGSIEYDEFTQEISDFIDQQIGPNYSQHFYKPAEYEKWGDKWYKKH